MFIIFSELRVPLFKGEGIISNYVRKVTTEASVLYIKEVAPENTMTNLSQITRLVAKD